MAPIFGPGVVEMALKGTRESACAECGAHVSKEAKFCSECGAEVSVGRVRTKKALLIGVALGVLILALFFSGSLSQVGGDAPVAPDFAAGEVLTGEEHSLSGHRGEWVLIDFSTSWCTTCQRMAPILDRYYQESKPDDVEFLTISNEGDDVESFQEFARENDAGWPHLIDPDSSIYVEYGVQGLPTFVLVDPEGKIRARAVGYMSSSAVERFVEDAKSEAKSEGSIFPLGL
ncbi:MAG: Thiol-disulfide oxidoreductase ResA [Methanonatronarchaeales archaeon]|nr:Thiol-disulfide oxidoreductase ResA [Methanonatronarchaeales archaeon]